MMRSESRQAIRGFTLVEVMVALLIIAVSLAALGQTVSGAIGNTETMRDRTYASWIAQNKIIEMRASGVVPKTGATSGDIVYAKVEWAWRAVVVETGIEGLLRVDVAVTRAGFDAPSRTVTGFIGEPVQPGSANRAWLGAGGAPGGSPDDEDSGETN